MYYVYSLGHHGIQLPLGGVVLAEIQAEIILMLYSYEMYFFSTLHFGYLFIGLNVTHCGIGLIYFITKTS